MKKYLIIYFSQTGQTKQAATMLENLLIPNAQVDLMVIHPQHPFPFPWGFKDFFGVFTRSVLDRGTPLKPIEVANGDYDMVFLLAQVWFLAPALPIQGIFQSRLAQVFAGRKVHLIITCRNMWLNTALSLKQKIHRAGGRLHALTVLEDTSPAWLSFITTPVWLIRGRKKFLKFREAGIDAFEFQSFRMEMEAMYGATADQSEGSRRAWLRKVQTHTIVLEKIGVGFFRLWAPIMENAKNKYWQGFLQIAFRINLVIMIILLLLVLPLFLRVFQKRFDGLVQQQLGSLGLSFN